MKRIVNLVFYIAIIGIAAAFFWSRYDMKDAVPGQSGHSTNEFHGLEIGGAFEVVLHRGDVHDIKITSDDERWLSEIRAEVKNGILHVKHEKKSWSFGKGIRLDVTAPKLRWIQLSGTAELETADPIKGDELFVKLSGAGHLDIDAEVGVFTAQLSGTGNLELDGEAENANFKISGIGNIDAYDFKVENLSAKISGTGNAEVYATRSIDARISGAGKISYKGNPKKVHSNVSGAGSIQKR